MRLFSIPLLCASVLGGLFLASVGSADAQIVLPGNPNQFTKRKLGENGGSTGGSSSVGVATRDPGAASRTIVIQIVAVSPVRSWTNTDGKTMNARLLAFSAPAEGEKGPVEVIKNGKVKFLLMGGKDPIEYPLEQLSPKDQVDIKAIAQAAKRSTPEEKEKGTEEP